MRVGALSMFAWQSVSNLCAFSAQVGLKQSQDKETLKQPMGVARPKLYIYIYIYIWNWGRGFGPRAWRLTELNVTLNRIPDILPYKINTRTIALNNFGVYCPISLKVLGLLNDSQMCVNAKAQGSNFRNAFLFSF